MGNNKKKNSSFSTCSLRSTVIDGVNLDTAYKNICGREPVIIMLLINVAQSTGVISLSIVKPQVRLNR